MRDTSPSPQLDLIPRPTSTTEHRKASLGTDWYEAYLERVAIKHDGARHEYSNEASLELEAFLDTLKAKRASER